MFIPQNVLHEKKDLLKGTRNAYAPLLRMSLARPLAGETLLVR